MKTALVPQNRSTRRTRLVASVAALAATFAVSPQPAHAGRINPPPVPKPIQVPEGNIPFLEGHGVGTQNYICLPCPNATTPATGCPDATGFAWLLFTPEATLFSDNEKPVTTHFFSPNPEEHGTIRATWQRSRDTRTVWGGQAIPSSDAKFVAPGAIPWLLLPKAGVQGGPTGSDTLTSTTFIQRLNTAGGAAPMRGCSEAKDVGAKAFIPYTADYFFYTKEGNDREDDD